MSGVMGRTLPCPGGNYAPVCYIPTCMYTIILNLRINNHLRYYGKKTETEICSDAVKNSLERL